MMFPFPYSFLGACCVGLPTFSYSKKRVVGHLYFSGYYDHRTLFYVLFYVFLSAMMRVSSFFSEAKRESWNVTLESNCSFRKYWRSALVSLSLSLCIRLRLRPFCYKIQLRLYYQFRRWMKYLKQHTPQILVKDKQSVLQNMLMKYNITFTKRTCRHPHVIKNKNYNALW